MEVIKGYKQTEIGVIPDDWNYKTINFLIKELTDFVAAGSFESLRNNVQVYDFENYALYVRLYDIRLGIGHDKQKYVDEQSYRFLNKSNLYGDEILMANIGANVGEAFLMPKTNMPATIAPNMIIIRSDEKKLISKYLFYYIVSNKGQKLLSELIAGSGHPKLNKTDLKKLNIIFPPSLKEQTAIANALSDTDTWINSLEQLLTKKRQIKQGAMQELLQPKEGWEVKKLTDVVDYIHGKAHEQHIDKFGKYVVVNSKFVSTEGEVIKYSKMNFCPAKKDDLLTVLSDLPNGKALAKCYYVNENDKYAVNQRICIWRSKGANQKFLFYILNRLEYFLKLNDGVSQTHILNHHIEKCEISVPKNKEEQTRIATILSDMDDEIAQLETKLAKAKQIKQGMMQELLTGRIRLV